MIDRYYMIGSYYLIGGYYMIDCYYRGQAAGTARTHATRTRHMHTHATRVTLHALTRSAAVIGSYYA